VKTTAAPDRHQDAGVTLVEVLVVLVLVGIMAGIVGLNIGSGSRGDIAKQEADLLVARLNRAADDVILTGVPMGFVWGAEGYRFDVYNGEIWVPHPLPVLKEPHLLAGRTRIVGSAGAIVVSTESRPTGDSPLSLELRAVDGAAEYVRFDGVSAAHLQEVE